MTERAKQFLQEVQNEEALFQKMEALKTETNEQVVIEAVVVLANEAGYSLQAQDFAPQEGELDEEELAAVMGGYKHCMCIVGGGGSKDHEGKTCGCVVVGSGLAKGDEEKKRCSCVFGGQGEGPL